MHAALRDLEVVPAPEAPDLTRTFIRKQIAALREFGCDLGLSLTPAWAEDPASYLVLARDRRFGDLMGGVRVHLRHGGNRIALEETFEDLDLAVCQRLHALAQRETIAEFSSLWVARPFRGGSLGRELMSAVVAVALKLGASRGVTFSSPQSKGVIAGLGFVPDQQTGDEGKFHYPDARYVSCLMWTDLTTTRNMSVERLQQVFELRDTLWLPPAALSLAHA